MVTALSCCIRLERTRDRFVLDACNRAEWDELLIRAGDVNAVQLFGVQPSTRLICGITL